MLALRLLSYIEKSLNQKGKVGNKDEVAFWCPICKLESYKKKLIINLDKDSSKFGNWHCWNCQISNKTSGKNLYTLYKKLNLLDKTTGLKELYNRGIPSNILNEEKTEQVFLPKDFISLTNKSNIPEYKIAMNYLYTRGIVMNDIYRYNIGYCIQGEYINRIILPSYDEIGKLNYFVSRIYYDNVKFNKYKNPKHNRNNVVFFEMLINWNFPIILVEGAFDAISVGSNAIPLLNKRINDELKKKIILKKVKDIYIALDPDAIKDSIRHIEYLMKNNINIYFIELDDEDPSKMGHYKFMEYYNSAKLMDFESLIKYKLRM